MGKKINLDIAAVLLALGATTMFMNFFCAPIFLFFIVGAVFLVFGFITTGIYVHGTEWISEFILSTKMPWVATLIFLAGLLFVGISFSVILQAKEGCGPGLSYLLLFMLMLGICMIIGFPALISWRSRLKSEI